MHQPSFILKNHCKRSINNGDIIVWNNLSTKFWFENANSENEKSHFGLILTKKGINNSEELSAPIDSRLASCVSRVESSHLWTLRTQIQCPVLIAWIITPWAMSRSTLAPVLKWKRPSSPPVKPSLKPSLEAVWRVLCLKPWITPAIIALRSMRRGLSTGSCLVSLVKMNVDGVRLVCCTPHTNNPLSCLHLTSCQDLRCYCEFVQGSYCSDGWLRCRHSLTGTPKDVC